MSESGDITAQADQLWAWFARMDENFEAIEARLSVIADGQAAVADQLEILTDALQRAGFLPPDEDS